MKALLSFLLLLSLHAAYSQRTNEGDMEIVFTNTFWETEKLSVRLNPQWLYRTDYKAIARYKSKDEKIFVMFGGTMGEEGFTRKEILEREKNRNHEAQLSNLAGDIIKGVELSSEYGEEEAQIGYAIPTSGDKMLLMAVNMPQSYRAEWEPYFDKVAQTFKLVE